MHNNHKQRSTLSNVHEQPKQHHTQRHTYLRRMLCIGYAGDQRSSCRRRLNRNRHDERMGAIGGRTRRRKHRGEGLIRRRREQHLHHMRRRAGRRLGGRGLGSRRRLGAQGAVVQPRGMVLWCCGVEDRSDNE
jgi:hypothetical protein